LDSDKAALCMRLHNLPAALKERKQWLLWRFKKYEGDKKARKVPYYATGRKREGVQGSVEDRDALVVFDVAISRLAAGRFDGIGFAFLPGDGLIGIDVDHAIGGDGVVSDLCREVVQACGSYTEYSPSRTGVHVIGLAGEAYTGKDNELGLEVFCGRQFFTCTGEHWGSTPAELQVVSAEAVQMMRRLIEQAKEGRRAKKARPAAAEPQPGGVRRPTQSTARSPQEDTPEQLGDRLRDALQAISPDVGYENWLQIGMGIKQGLGDVGFAIWDEWSSKGSKYPGSENLARKWASFGGNAITEATVFQLAIDAGWKPPKRPRKPRRPEPPPEAYDDVPAPRSSGAGDGGSTPSNGSAEGGGEREHKQWRRKLLRSENGIKDCRENVYMQLSFNDELKGLVAFDEFSHRVMKQREPPWQSAPGEWTTNDDYELGLYLATHESMVIKAEATLVAGVAMAAWRAKYHPVRDYLNGLTWDGTDRLRYWLHECMGAADSTYVQLVGTFFILGMVNRVLNPGCQMDNMLVFEGGQGAGKSSALRVLAGQWFADTPIRIGDKDALLNLAGVWLYEVGELDAFNKAEVTAVKQYVSSRVDRVREPFARRPIDRPRSGVFSGTTNQHEYFKDPTGSRRFWPVAVANEIQLQRLAEWRDQLFAEAMHRLAQGERYHPTREELKQHIEPEQEAREIQDPWFERIALWLEQPDQELKHEYTSSEILSGALHVAADKIDNARQMATRVGICMRKLKWGKAREPDGARLWRYIRPGKEPSWAGRRSGALAQVSNTAGGTGGPAPTWSSDDWEGQTGAT
jgi:putative DNA primase/helicase